MWTALISVKGTAVQHTRSFEYDLRPNGFVATVVRHVRGKQVISGVLSVLQSDVLIFPSPGRLKAPDGRCHGWRDRRRPNSRISLKSRFFLQADGMLSDSARPIYALGEYEIDLARRELRVQGTPVPIGGRAFEIVEVLVQSAGQLVAKNELIDRIWPGAIVNDNTLQVHISAVRKALGSQRAMLKTESGRGYRLLGNWAIQHRRPTGASVIPFPKPGGAIASPALRDAKQAPAGNLPVLVTHLVGRSDALPLIHELLSAYRVVTLAGPGGIGKTTFALHAAQGLRTVFDAGSWFVELASQSGPDLVPSAVAAVLGLKVPDVISSESVARAIGATRLLLLLDNCEHVIDAAAELAETLVRHCPRVTILATTREPLRIEGEHIYRVPPLDVPASTVEKPGDLLEHSSIELFIARAQAQDSSFTPDAATLPVVAEICRHLDGIPLAIEFAAARAATLGLPQVAAMLDDRFGLLTGGRRTALPRHQTLRATLDWSYDLLTEEERELLCRLAIFPAGFTLEGAVAVSGKSELGGGAVANGVASLIQKSLVMVEAPGARPRWRLLETIRSYALDKLANRGERDAIARGHAAYYCVLFEHAEDEAATRSRAKWLADYAPEIDNIRAALDWAFSPGGEPEIGVTLTVASGLLWTRLSLSDECRRLTERALSALRPESELATRRQIQLLALLGRSLEETVGVTSEMKAAFSKIFELSERIKDNKTKSLAIWGLWIYHFNNGEFETALEMAQNSISEEGVDASHLLAGERIIGLSLHYLGEQSRARQQIENALRRPVDPLNQPHDVRSSFDHHVTLRSFHARILWLQGFSDQAMRTAKENVEEALGLNHELSLANALVQAACPIAFYIGDLVAAEHFVCMLLDHSTKHALGPWQAWGRCFEGMLLVKRGDTVTGVQRLNTAVSSLRDIGYAVYYVAFAGELAEALGRAGQTAHGLATIDEALARSDRSKERWCVAELLRIKGELVVLQETSGATRTAEEYFQQSLDWARRQGALSWELRTATSLARLMLNRGEPEPAKQLLAPVFRCFTEGFDTADLKAAKGFLDTLP
jgi:predicted ATPase/DNA-binding winged helix-turn-helix (wHTH) protein